MNEWNFWLKYPLMIESVEGDNTIYRGSVHIHNEDYAVSITKSQNNSFTITLPEKLTRFENEICSAINDLDPKNIVTILDCLVKVTISKMPSSIPINHCDIYRHILNEYSEFTKFYLNIKSCYLAQDLSKIDISIMDERNREHYVEVSVNYDDSRDVFKITMADLPQGKETFKESSSLKAIYDQFCANIDALQPFFNLMDVFDKNCWVLDPLEPRRMCTYRRINLGENLSVVITVDPYNVLSIPNLKFLGPERLVGAYRETINRNIENWSPENDVYLELLKLLGLDSFPQKSVAKERAPDILKEAGDCSICFSIRLNGKLPEVVCKHKFCENYYHVECLYEWLISVNARRFFNEVVGQCPNCEKNISCPVPN